MRTKVPTFESFMNESAAYSNPHTFIEKLKSLVNDGGLPAGYSNSDEFMADLWPDLSWDQSVSKKQAQYILANHSELVDASSKVLGIDLRDELMKTVSGVEE